MHGGSISTFRLRLLNPKSEVQGILLTLLYHLLDDLSWDLYSQGFDVTYLRALWSSGERNSVHFRMRSLIVWSRNCSWSILKWYVHKWDQSRSWVCILRIKVEFVYWVMEGGTVKVGCRVKSRRGEFRRASTDHQLPFLFWKFEYQRPIWPKVLNYCFRTLLRVISVILY